MTDRLVRIITASPPLKERDDRALFSARCVGRPRRPGI